MFIFHPQFTCASPLPDKEVDRYSSCLYHVVLPAAGFHEVLLEAASPRLPSWAALSRTVCCCYGTAVKNTGSGFRQFWF